MPKKPHVDDEPLELHSPPANIVSGLSRYEVALGDGEEQFLTNLDLSTERGKALLINASNPADLVFDKDRQIRITAVNFLLFPDQVQDEDTGELREFTRTVLIDREGHTYQTTSMFAPRRMRAVLRLWSPERWAEGITFVITERQSRRPGRKYHDMRVEVPT
jgi:hypothetical protein